MLKFYLNKLQSDLRNFNEDRIHLIETYLDKTGFHSHLLSALIQIREQLSQHSDPELYAKFTQTKSDLIEYLKLKADRSASDPIEDVVFACQVVLKNKLKEGIPVVREDLLRLIEQFPKNDQLKQLLASLDHQKI